MNWFIQLYNNNMVYKEKINTTNPNDMVSAYASYSNYNLNDIYNKFKLIVDIIPNKNAPNFNSSTVTVYPINYKNEILIPQFLNLVKIPDIVKTLNKCDFLYENSELDILFKKIIGKALPECAWVEELGHKLIDKIEFKLDDYVVDEYDSYLLSILNRMTLDYNQINSYNKNLISQDKTIITYDDTNKGIITIRLPLNFWFSKNSGSSMPMIKLLYTQGLIKFKTSSLDDLFIKDKDAIWKTKPKLTANMNAEYMFVEEDERKRVSLDKHDYLIERFRYGGKFYCTYNNIINNTLLTKLRFDEPTKYIIWRVKIQNNNKSNWTNNSLSDNIPQKTITKNGITTITEVINNVIYVTTGTNVEQNTGTETNYSYTNLTDLNTQTITIDLTYETCIITFSYDAITSKLTVYIKQKILTSNSIIKTIIFNMIDIIKSDYSTIPINKFDIGTLHCGLQIRFDTTNKKFYLKVGEIKTILTNSSKTKTNIDTLKIFDKINIIFNGQIREQSDASYFSTIQSYEKGVNSLNTNEFLYSFSIYPLLLNPSGSANLGMLEEFCIQHIFNNNFLNLMNLVGLELEFDYWTSNYQILRFVSGMAGPLFLPKN